MLSISIVIGGYDVGDTISLNDQNTVYNICYDVTNDEISGEYPEGQMSLSDFNGALNGGAYSILIITLNRGEMFNYVHDTSWQGYFDDPEIKNITNLYAEDGWCEYYGNSGIVGFPLIFSDNSFIHLFYTQDELNNDCVFPTHIILDHTMTVRYEYCGNMSTWGIISSLQMELEEFLNEISTGCTDPVACNYDESATDDDGSCEYDFDCAGTCGGELELDCCGVCGGDNSQCSNCCGSPFYEDCTDDCSIDLNGICCYEIEVDACGECNGNGTDCNNNGIPDDCEETYTYGYNAGYIDGLITGQIGSDENNDGLVDDFPLITILGNTALVLTQNFEATYTDDGASCFVGETNISQNVEVSGDVVNLSNIGTYVLSYNCQDNVLGNQAITKYRTVIVQADYSDEDNDGFDDASYTAGLEEGILLGGQSGDANGDGILNILDIVYFLDAILNP